MNHQIHEYPLINNNEHLVPDWHSLTELNEMESFSHKTMLYY